MSTVSVHVKPFIGGHRCLMVDINVHLTCWHEFSHLFGSGINVKPDAVQNRIGQDVLFEK